MTRTYCLAGTCQIQIQSPFLPYVTLVRVLIGEPSRTRTTPPPVNSHVASNNESVITAGPSPKSEPKSSNRVLSPRLVGSLLFRCECQHER